MENIYRFIFSIFIRLLFARHIIVSRRDNSSVGVDRERLFVHPNRRIEAFLRLTRLQQHGSAAHDKIDCVRRFGASVSRRFGFDQFKTQRIGQPGHHLILQLEQVGAIRRQARRPVRIARHGPHTLVIKRGEYGAVLFRGRECHFFAPGYLLEDVFDPTGAGDCFAGGFIGYLAGRGIEWRTAISISPNCGAP